MDIINEAKTNLVSIDKEGKREINQQEGQYYGCKDRKCKPEEPEQKKSGNFSMVREG